MGYVFYNPNPLQNLSAGDCTIRAISKAMDWDWEKTYSAICLQGFRMAEMPSSNSVWGTFLLQNGFEEHSLMKRCTDCYNIINFCIDHPKGTFVIGTGEHALCICDGKYYDTFDSGDMIPTYYFEKLTKEDDSHV